MAGMFAIGVGVYVMGQQIGMINDSIKTIEQGMAGKVSAAATPSQVVPAKIAVESSCDTVPGSSGLCYDRPKGWAITYYDDQFTSGQKNTQVSDSVSGVRITIERLHQGQAGLKGPAVAGYSGLYELGEMCDGETCPHGAYLREFNPGNNYAIRVYYDWAKRDQVKPLIDTVLQSLELGLF